MLADLSSPSEEQLLPFHSETGEIQLEQTSTFFSNLYFLALTRNKIFFSSLPFHHIQQVLRRGAPLEASGGAESLPMSTSGCTQGCVQTLSVQGRHPHRPMGVCKPPERRLQKESTCCLEQESLSPARCWQVSPTVVFQGTINPIQIRKAGWMRKAFKNEWFLHHL